MKVAFCCMAAASAGVRHGHEDAPVATAQAANDMAAVRVQLRRSPAFLAPPLEGLAYHSLLLPDDLLRSFVAGRASGQIVSDTVLVPVR